MISPADFEDVLGIRPMTPRPLAQLYASAKVQRQVGASSEHDLLGIQLALLQARQNVVDARAALSESSVTLVKNLGGGWQWKVADQPAARAADNATRTRSDQ